MRQTVQRRRSKASEAPKGERFRSIQDPDRRKAGHSHLVASVTELLIEKGFHRTSVRDMAEEADWSMGTLYLYIKRKEDILRLISEEVQKRVGDEVRWRFDERLSGRTDSRPADVVLEDAIKRFFELNDQYRRQINLLYRESASMLPEHLEVIKEDELDTRGVFERLLERGFRESVFRPHDSKLVAHTIIMLGHMWALKGWNLHQWLSLEDYTRLQTEELIDGIRVRS